MKNSNIAQAESLNQLLEDVQGTVVSVTTTPNEYTMIHSYRQGVEQPNSWTMIDTNLEPLSGYTKNGKLAITTRAADKSYAHEQFKFRRPRISRFYAHLHHGATEMKSQFNKNKVTVTLDNEYKSKKLCTL